MKRIESVEQLSGLPYFDKGTVSRLGYQMGLKDATIDTYISRFEIEGNVSSQK